MFGNSDIRRYLMPVFVAVALVAIAIPTCQMIGCSMDMSRGMFLPNMAMGASITNQCDGSWISSAGPAGVTPTGVDPFFFALLAALVAAAVLLAPRTTMTHFAVQRAEPPPPPEDPRGARFIV